jgi:hypothetical protein
MRQQRNAKSSARCRDLTSLVIGTKAEPLATKLACQPSGFGKLSARFVKSNEDRQNACLQPVTPLAQAIESVADSGEASRENVTALGPAETQRNIRLMSWQAHSPAFCDYFEIERRIQLMERH